jgi:hypothetical protein
MIRNTGKLFLMLCLLVVGGGVVAHAQVNTVPQIESDIPFSFAVGDTKLPAGIYEIRTPDNGSPNLLEIRNVKTHKSVLFNTENAQTGDDQVTHKTELVFDKVGEQYFLYQVWVAGSDSGSELPKSKMEKRLLDGGSRPEKHSVAASMKQTKS